jgi:hypothetical protein
MTEGELLNVPLPSARVWGLCKLGLFPLTPALSLGERENARLSVDESEVLGVLASRTPRLPLPKGEGRGEGEEDAQSATVAAVMVAWKQKNPAASLYVLCVSAFFLLQAGRRVR